LPARRRGFRGRGFRGGEGRGGSGGGRGGEPTRNSDVKRGRSRRSLSVRGVGREKQKKTWPVVKGSTPQEGQRG